MPEKKVAIIGAGMIGAGLGVNALMHGYPTTLQTMPIGNEFEDMKKRVAKILDTMVKNNVCTREEADAAAALATYTTSIEEAATGADFVLESIVEKIEIKHEVYAEIEKHCSSETIIASSTTALLPSALQEKAIHPERILVGHPYNPSYLIPLVEICGGSKTSEASIQRAKEFYESIGKIPVVCKKEVLGFLVNRMSWAALAEAKKTVLEGCCTVEEMDTAIMYGPGLRMAILGMLLTISQGTAGGYRASAKKFGREPSPDDEVLASGVDAFIANRDPEIGNTVEGVNEYLDKMIVEILRLKNKL